MGALRYKKENLWWKRAQRALMGLGIALLLFNAPLPALAEADSSASQTNTTTTVSEPMPPAPAPNTGDIPAPAPTPALSLVEPAASPVLNTATSVTNNVTGTATSGDASVTDNKKAGDATSGNASANANVLNIANSNATLGGTVNVFTQNIGDSNEDIIIDPATLLPTAKNGSSANGSLQTNVSLTDILNNITLSAQSGDATVSGNKKAGDATTGDASALANIVNIVGSTIAAKNSFLGIINIYGNLKGDILVPKSFVDSLVNNANAPGSLTNGSANTTIENNVTANATSGDATVSGNKKAGDATTGDATSSITVFNLTGQQVVAKNSLLVFVNVMGKWVGMIVPAPGSNSAILGGGVEQSGQSANGIAGDTTTNITNNISVTATSGDASVTDNKKAGNATSGKATAGANLVNITNSDFQLGDWFGALFINVLGTWVGDFGIKDDTPVVDNPGTGVPEQPIQDVQIFRFDSEAPVSAVSDDGYSDDSYSDRSIALTAQSGSDTPSGHVLGSSTTDNDTTKDVSNASHSIGIDLVALAAIIGALTLLLALGSLAVRRRFSNYQRV